MENNANQAVQQQPEPAPVPVQKTSLGMEENIEGLLCYLFGWLSGLVLLLVEKNSKFVRFHAVQSLVVGGAVTVLYILFNSILFSLFWSLWGVISLIVTLIGLGYAAVSIFMMFKAYKKEMFKLPLVGAFAEKTANK